MTTSNDALGLADKISFQIKYHPDALLTADEARLVIAALRSPSVPANGAGREALEALKALLAASDMNRDDIPDRDQYALLLKCQERARSALASPVVGRAEWQDMNLRDKHGRQIKRGDVLKVYHFTGARRKRHYMYKHVMGTRTLGSSAVYAVLDHLDLDCGHYLELCDGRTLADCEIVQSVDAKFEERSRAPLNPPAPSNGETGISAVGGAT